MGELRTYMENRYTISDNGCWEWLAALHRLGYGVVNAKGYRGKKAHRVSYEMYVGPIPEGLLVCHSCDNRKCINPKHLWVGTQDDNMKDMVAKGRYVKGKIYTKDKHHNAKLSLEEVVDIRNTYSTGLFTGEMLGEVYGVSYGQVLRITRGDKWKL